MQVDWAVIRRGSNRLSVFVATLGWSRAAYVEFVIDERVETLIEAHENAFFAFGGVPREVLYDNMRTVVLERHGYGRGRHRFHPGFLDFARHCGFRLRLCAPYRAQTKGKVERFIRFLRQSFYIPLASRLAQDGLMVDRETANLAVKRWLREVANARIHGTTGEIPAERLVRESRICNRSRWLMAGAWCVRSRPGPSRVRSSASNTRCRSTTSLPAARHDRFAAPAPG
jgi:transposase